MSKAIIMSEKDNVATALDELRGGERVTMKNGEEREVTIAQDIPFGHKFAIRAIEKGEQILKYGEIIAGATQGIQEGEHVHVHNVESLRGRGDLARGE
ncbi:MAG: UxaA family hydrolase [Methanomassiliicoccales archaeon]